MIQVHPGSAVQLLTIAVALLLYRRRVRPAHVVAGAAVFAAQQHQLQALSLIHI